MSDQAQLEGDDTRDLNQQTWNGLIWNRHTGQHRAEGDFNRCALSPVSAVQTGVKALRMIPAQEKLLRFEKQN